MLKIPQAMLQKYMNQELPDVQAGFRNSRGTRDQIANIRWIIEKERIPEKTSTSASLTTLKLLTCVDHSTLGRFFKRWNSRPPYLPPEKSVYGSKKIVRTEHGTMDWFKTGKGVHQGCILSPCLFNLYAESIMSTLGWKKHKLESVCV